MRILEFHNLWRALFTWIMCIIYVSIYGQHSIIWRPSSMLSSSRSLALAVDIPMDVDWTLTPMLRYNFHKSEQHSDLIDEGRRHAFSTSGYLQGGIGIGVKRSLKYNLYAGSRFEALMDKFVVNGRFAMGELSEGPAKVYTNYELRSFKFNNPRLSHALFFGYEWFYHKMSIGLECSWNGLWSFDTKSTPTFYNTSRTNVHKSSIDNAYSLNAFRIDRSLFKSIFLFEILLGYRL